MALSAFADVPTIPTELLLPRAGDVLQGGKWTAVRWRCDYSAAHASIKFTPMGYWISPWNNQSWFNVRSYPGSASGFPWLLPHFKKTQTNVYMMIRTNSNDPQPLDIVGPFTIAATPPDQYEPNDNPQTAMNLRLNDTLGLAIVTHHANLNESEWVFAQLNPDQNNPKSLERWRAKMQEDFRDEDWFRIETAGNTRISFDDLHPCDPLQGLCQSPVRFRLFSARGELLATSQDEKLVFDVPKDGNGTYYLLADPVPGVEPHDEHLRQSWSSEYILATSSGEIPIISEEGGAKKYLARGLDVGSGIKAKRLRSEFSKASLAVHSHNGASISYRIVESNQVSLSIYGMAGDKVETLQHGYQSAGTYQLNWGGLGKRGNRAPSGMYIVILQSGKTTLRKRVLLMR